MAQDKFNAKADTVGLSMLSKNQYMEKHHQPCKKSDLKQQTLG